MKKQRNFVVTNWNCDAEIYQQLIDDKKIQFIAYGEETCPTTGKAHHQAFLYFHNPKSTGAKNLCRIGKMFGDTQCDVRPMKGSFTQCEAYCGKESSLVKLGVEPKQGERGDLKELKDQILSGDMTAEDVAVADPHTYHMYGRTLQQIETIALRKKFRTEMTTCTWYTGPSGAGKSHMVFADYSPETHFIKDLSVDWWDGYCGQPIVILNEFRGEIKFSQMCALVDKWPMTVPIRCKESVPFLAREIRVACIKSPKEVYHRTAAEDGEPWQQFERRIKTVRLLKRSISEIGTEVLKG